MTTGDCGLEFDWCVDLSNLLEASIVPAELDE